MYSQSFLKESRLFGKGRGLGLQCDPQLLDERVTGGTRLTFEHRGPLLVDHDVFVFTRELMSLDFLCGGSLLKRRPSA